MDQSSRMTNHRAFEPRLAVFDDDPMFLMQVRQYSRKHGIRVRVCANSDDFHKLHPNEDFDAIIMDYDLGKSMNGLEFAQEIHGAPVILVSASKGWAKDERELPESIFGFVSKKSGVSAIVEAAIDAASKIKA